MQEKEIYSEMILELYKHPMNFGSLKQADMHLEGGNPLCGDQVLLDVRVKHGKIEEIKFSGMGCAISRASASLLTERVKGMKLEDVMKIRDKEIFDDLGGIIETRLKCALLGLLVLKKGIDAFEKNGRKWTLLKGITV